MCLFYSQSMSIPTNEALDFICSNNSFVLFRICSTLFPQTFPHLFYALLKWKVSKSDLL